jgi:hypothetical protein
VLESNREICEDPRAIAISGDTYRILRVMGINAQQFQEFGQRELNGNAQDFRHLTEITAVNQLHFHDGLWTTEPFFTLDQTRDWLNQGMTMGLCILQPTLGR